MKYFKSSLAHVLLALITLTSIASAQSSSNQFVYLKNSAGILVGVIVHDGGLAAQIKIRSYCLLQKFTSGITCEAVDPASPFASDPNKALKFVNRDPSVTPDVFNKIQSDISNLSALLGHFNQPAPENTQVADAAVPTQLEGSDRRAVANSTGDIQTPSQPAPQPTPPVAPQYNAPVQSLPDITGLVNAAVARAVSGIQIPQPQPTPVTPSQVISSFFSGTPVGTQSPGSPAAQYVGYGAGDANNPNTDGNLKSLNLGSGGLNTPLALIASSTVGQLNATAAVVGNSTVTNIYAGNLTGNLATFTNLYVSGVFNTASGSFTVVATTSNFSSLNASTSNASTTNTNDLIATRGTITSATSTNLFASFANILSGLFGAIVGDSIQIRTITATSSAYALNSYASSSFASTSNIASLNVTNATLSNATVTNSFATTQNVTNASVTNLTVGGNNITNVITNIATTLNTQNVNASTTNASTSNAQNLTVSGSSTLASTTVTNLTSTGNLGGANLAVSGSSTIGSTTASNVSIIGSLASAIANIVNAVVTTLTATVANIVTGNVATLNSGSVNTTNLTATGTTQLTTIYASTTNASTSNIASLNATNATLTNATSTNLFASGNVTVAGNATLTSAGNLTTTGAVSAANLSASGSSTLGSTTVSNITSTGNVAGQAFTGGTGTFSNLSSSGSTTLGSTTASNLSITGNLAALVLNAVTAAFSTITSTVANIVTGNVATLNSGNGNFTNLNATGTTQLTALYASTTNASTSNANTGSFINLIASGSSTLGSSTIANLTVPGSFAANNFNANTLTLALAPNGWLYTNATGQVFASSSPTVSYITATTSTSTFAGINLGGSIVPVADAVYDLGSPSKRFKSLYVSSSTIYIDGVALSNTAGQLTWAGSGIVATAGQSQLASTTISNATVTSTLYVSSLNNLGGLVFATTSGLLAQTNAVAYNQAQNKLILTGGITTGATVTAAGIDMNSTRIVNLLAPVNTTDAVNKAYVDSAFASGVLWQAPVKTISTSTAPGSPAAGDRYLLQAGQSGFGTCSNNDVAEWNSSAWVCTTPATGTTVFVDSTINQQYNFNGSAWVSIAQAIDHNTLYNLQGGQAGEYYHLKAADYTALTAGTAQLSQLQTTGNPTFNSINLTYGISVASTSATSATLTNATSTILSATNLKASGSSTLASTTVTNLTSTGNIGGANLAVSGSSTIGSTTASNLTVTGNFAAAVLNAITSSIANLFATNGYITTLYATTTNASTSNVQNLLTTGSSTIGSTTASNVSVTGNLAAAILNAVSAVIGTLTASVGNIATLNSGTFNVTNINATGTSQFTTLLASTTSASSSSIGNATITNATITGAIAFGAGSSIIATGGTSTFATSTIASATLTYALNVPGTATVATLTAATSTITNLSVNGGIINRATLTAATATNLFATNASMSAATATAFFANNASISSVTANSLAASIFSALTASFSSLFSPTIYVTNLYATTTSASTSYVQQALGVGTSTNIYGGALTAGETVNGGIVLSSTTSPATTTQALYNNNGTLYFNGSALGGFSGYAPSGQFTNLYASTSYATTSLASSSIVTNATLTNATATNLFASTASATNVLALNATLTSATASNLFASSASIAAATTTSFYTSVMQAVSSILGTLNISTALGIGTTTNIYGGTLTTGATLNGGLVIASTTPATTTQALYQNNGNLYWNGTNVSSALSSALTFSSAATTSVGSYGYLSSNTTNALTSISNGITAFSTAGFTLGSNSLFNTSGNSYVAWNWKKGSTPGFDEVAYTGTGAAHTITHSLGGTPAFMIIKRTDTAGSNWAVYHQSLGNTQALLMNSTAAAASSATYWNNTTPTSASFTVGTSADTDTSGGSYVAYVWKEVPGFSKFGSYTGNGSSDGPFVYTGFKPRYVMLKATSITEDWIIIDTVRGTANPFGSYLAAEAAQAENANNVNRLIDFNANGFKLRSDGTALGFNGNGNTIVYAAFAEAPFEYATTNSGVSIASSTRFNGTNAYLSRTPGAAGNQQKWTLSAWVKHPQKNDIYLLSAGNQSWPSSPTEANITITSTGGWYFAEYNHDFVTHGSTYQLRDPSKWYHLVFAMDTTQAASSDRLKVYIDGVRQSISEVDPIDANASYSVNAAGVQQRIGYSVINNVFASAYISDMYLVDGQQLTPTSFAQSDSNGRWSPKTYSGTYGTDGFHLPLMGTSSAASIGTDTSGNGNFFTNNNIATTDFVADSPTNNFPIMSSLVKYNTGAGNTPTMSNGGLTLTGGGSVAWYDVTGATYNVPTSGQYYWETTVNNVGGSMAVGLHHNRTTALSLYTNSGLRYCTAGTSAAYGSTYTTGDVIGTAVDMSTGKIFFSKNGVWQNSGDPVTGTNPACSDLLTYLSTEINWSPMSELHTSAQSTVNFGQGGQSGLSYSSTAGGYFKYTPPTGFKALSSANLISAGVSSIIKGSTYFDAVTYTGTGSSMSISTLAFTPDLVWIKDRTSANNHGLFTNLASFAGSLTTYGVTTTGAVPFYDSNGALTTTNMFNFATSSLTLGIGTTTSTGFRLTVAGAVCLDINSDGACTDSTSAISDERLKTNVATVTDAVALNAKLHPVFFDWNATNTLGLSVGHAHSLGFLAQEVTSVFPTLDITGTTTDGFMVLDYGKLTALLSAAVQEISTVSGSFKTNLIAWMGDAANGIDTIVSQTLKSHILCLDEVCLNSTQLKTLMSNNGLTPVAVPAASSSTTSTSTPSAPGSDWGSTGTVLGTSTAATSSDASSTLQTSSTTTTDVPVAAPTSSIAPRSTDAATSTSAQPPASAANDNPPPANDNAPVQQGDATGTAQ